MNIDEYNRSRNRKSNNGNRNSSRKKELDIPDFYDSRERSSRKLSVEEVNVPHPPKKAAPHNSSKKRKKKKRIRWDKIIGCITIAVIILFTLIIIKDFQGVDKAAEAVNATVANVDNKDDNNTILSTTKANKRIVCIDAGHGGTDPGADASGMYEKDHTLMMAQLVKKNLEAAGYTCIMTRTTDSKISLENRVSIAKKAKATVMVSLHRNYYAGPESVRGIEAWILNSSPSDAQKLADTVLGQLGKISGTEIRGIKTGTMADANTNYYINREAPMTSMILELGFITNTQDNALFTTQKTACAKAISDGIIAYIEELE